MNNHVSRLSRAPRKGKTDKPKRPLSAYNLFFQDERIKLLESIPQPNSNNNKKSHGKIGFAGLARTLADKWKVTDQSTRLFYEELAAKEKRRYALDMVKWAQEQEEDSLSSVNRGLDIPIEISATYDKSPISASTKNNSEQNYSFAESIKEENPTKLDHFIFQDSCDESYPVSINSETQQFDSSRKMIDPNAYMVPSYEISEEIPSWSQITVEPDAPDNCNMFHCSGSDSSHVVHAFFEQPGMEDFITNMYTLLSQKSDDQSHSQTCPNLAVGKISKTNPMHLPQLSFQSQGEMHVADIFLGNIAPLEPDDSEEFAEDEIDVCLGDVFETTWLPN